MILRESIMLAGPISQAKEPCMRPNLTINQ